MNEVSKMEIIYYEIIVIMMIIIKKKNNKKTINYHYVTLYFRQFQK